jgi:hypothetical protein
MSDAPVISDGPPFYREHAPVGALDTETYLPASETTELGGWGEKGGGWGGGSQGEGPGLVGGGGEGGGLGREKHL